MLTKREVLALMEGDGWWLFTGVFGPWVQKPYTEIASDVHKASFRSLLRTRRIRCVGRRGTLSAWELVP